MILRVIDKETKIFLRDDFTFDEETEIGLNVEPSQALISPMWKETETINEQGEVVIIGEWVESVKEVV